MTAQAPPIETATAPDVVAQPTRFVKRGRVPLRDRAGRAALFASAFTAYALLGWQVTIVRHVSPGDAVSRLTHAFFVFYNVPHKLSAVGFVWPPVMTAVLLPFAAVKPLATSLWALPLMTATFGAALLVTIDKALALGSMPWPRRLTLVVLVGVNPMVACYASNGMSEIVALWLLTFAVVEFQRWYASNRPQHLIMCGIFLGLGALTRYEIALYAGVLAAAAAAFLVRRPHARREIEASVVALIAPAAYALGVWSFLNWTIVGDPLSWWRQQSEAAFAVTNGEAQRSALGYVAQAFHVTGALFPPTLLAVVGLLVWAIVRRDVFGCVLAALLLVNPLTTAALAVHSQAENVLQLRYNNRSTGLVLLAVAWVYSRERRRGRMVVWAASVVALTAALPAAWHEMATNRDQYLEAPFLRAVATGRDQDGHYAIGLRSPIRRREEEQLASYIRSHVHGRDVVLADDAQAFTVILRSGEPGLFLDRVDVGDARWTEIAHNPWPRVRYLLITDQAKDLLHIIYQREYTSGGGRGLKPVFSTGTGRLFLVTPPASA